MSYSVRRIRCRLLLPPGWVALGLLLGCLLVRGQWQRLQPLGALPLTMPALRQPPGKVSPCFPAVTVELVRRDLRQIPRWQSLEFTGRLSDSLVARHLPLAIRSLKDSPQTQQGLAIRLALATRYRHLVYALDLLAQQELPRYALDLHQSPAVLYVFHPHYQGRPLPCNERLTFY